MTRPSDRPLPQMDDAMIAAYQRMTNSIVAAMGRHLDGWQPLGFSQPEPSWVRPTEPADAHKFTPMADWFSRLTPPSAHFFVDGDHIIPTNTQLSQFGWERGGNMAQEYIDFKSLSGRTVQVAPSIYDHTGTYFRINKDDSIGGRSTLGAWLNADQLPEFADALFRQSGAIKVKKIENGYVDEPEYTTDRDHVDMVWVADDDDAETELHNAVLRLRAVVEYRQRKAEKAAAEAELRAKKEAEQKAAEKAAAEHTERTAKNEAKARQRGLTVGDRVTTRLGNTGVIESFEVPADRYAGDYMLRKNGSSRAITAQQANIVTVHREDPAPTPVVNITVNGDVHKADVDRIVAAIRRLDGINVQSL
jgi:hypothetical protein